MGKFTFQETDTRKPLLAVSDVNKKGNPCWFDSHQSFIMPKSAPELVEIRRLVQQAARTILLQYSSEYVRHQDGTS